MYGAYVRTTWAPLAADTGTDVAPGSWGCGTARATDISPRAEKTKVAFIIGSVYYVCIIIRRETSRVRQRLTVQLTREDPEVGGNAQRLQESTQTRNKYDNRRNFSRSYYSYPFVLGTDLNFENFLPGTHETKQGGGLFRVLIGGSLLFFGCGPQPENKQ